MYFGANKFTPSPFYVYQCIIYKNYSWQKNARRTDSAVLTVIGGHNALIRRFAVMDMTSVQTDQTKKAVVSLILNKSTNQPNRVELN